MTESSFKLKVITPSEVFFEGDVVSVVAPGSIGYFGVLKNHAPFVTTISEGNLAFRDEQGKSQNFKIKDGFIEVSNNRVLVLTDQVSGS